MIGTNEGHGHAWKRPDGLVARCSGPALCGECARDFAAVHGGAFPRRSYLEHLTREEMMLRDMVTIVEALGAHPLLTDCIVHLDGARTKLAEWVDLRVRPAKEALTPPAPQSP